MKKFFSSLWLRRYLAVFGGLLLTTAFPQINFTGAAWIAPALILFTAMGTRGWHAFRLGYIAGLAHFLTSLSWLLLIPYTWHGIPLGPALGLVALSAYLSLFFAVWIWICWRIFPKTTGVGTAMSPQNAEASAANESGGIFIGDKAVPTPLLEISWRQRAWWCFCCAVAWVALEMLRGRLLSGFPWNFLGASQFKLLPLIQIASITGVYGVSFVVSWFSIALGVALLILIRRPTEKPGLLGEMFVPLLTLALLVSFGFTKLGPIAPKSAELKVALVQPSIPQSLIWDPNENATRFQQTLLLTQRALASKPDLVVWPESAMPPANEENFTALTRLISSNHVWMILCADDVEVSPRSAKETKYYNASFLFSPDGGYVAKYRKQRLVMFGEYVPLIDWIPFLKEFTPIEGGFTPGTNAVQFELQDPHAKTSVLICFEDVFPHGARTHVATDTDFLVNLTSDAWFGHGAAHWQQAASALFRAVENGVPLLRCTNDGLTCWVDAQGRMREVFHDRDGGIYGPGFILVKVPLLAPGETHATTFYNQNGDVFGWGCVGLTLLMVVLGGFRRSDA